MGTEVKPEDRMTCEEIRLRHSRGAGPRVLAELNACSQKIIDRILAGEDYVWEVKKNKPKGDHNNKLYVVNVEEGIIYGSVRDAERAEGFKQSFLQKRFKRDGPRTMVGDVEFHLYRLRKEAE